MSNTKIEDGTIIAFKKWTMLTSEVHIIEEEKDNKQEIHNKLFKYKEIMKSTLKEYKYSQREF